MVMSIVLATKVSTHPATIAELCWLDDPKYITGYVVDGLSDLHAYIDYLEKQPIFVQWGEDECHTS